MLQEDLELLKQWATSDEVTQRSLQYAAPIQPTIEEPVGGTETTWEKAKRLGKAALAYGIVEPLAGVLDLPGALHLPGTEPGVWTKQAKEWEQGLGLKGTTGEAAAGLAGGLLGYMLPYGLAAKGLEAAGTALGVGRAGQMLGETAPVVTRAVEGYEALNPLVQTGIREGARGAAVWGLTEAGKPEEYRSSLGEFTASNVAGAVGFNLLGKLISKVRGSGVPHEEGAPGTQAREGSEPTLPSLVAGIREGEPVRSAPSTDEVIVRPTVPAVADEVQTTPPAATAPVTTRGVAPADTDLIAKAEALKRYWEGKTGTYRTTSQGLVTKTGESKTYTRVNEARAARNADMLDSILTALRNGQATDRQIEVLNTMWATRVKTKAGRAEMAALGYKPTEPAPESVVTPPKTKTQEELIKEAEFTADEEARLDRELNALPTRPSEISTAATAQQPVSPDEAANSIRRAYEAVTQAHMKKYGLTEAPDQPLLATEVADEWGKQQGLKPSQARKQFRELVAKIMAQGTQEDISFGSVRDVKNSLGRVRIGDNDFQIGTVHVRKTTVPEILPELQAGDTVRYSGASFTVVDASDPTLLRLRSAAGDEFVLPRNMVEVPAEELPTAQTPIAKSAPQSASALAESRVRRYSGAEYKHLAREARRILKEVSKEPEFVVHLQNKDKYISKADFLEADRVDRSGYIDEMATYGFVVDVTEGPNQRMIAPTEFVKAGPKTEGVVAASRTKQQFENAPESKTEAQSTEPTPPVWENAIPGTEEWNRIVRENPQLKDSLQTREREFWDGIATRLTPTEGDVVYTDAIRKLPEVAKGGLTVPTVAKQLKSRGFKIGDPVDRVLDSVDVKSGATVDVKTLMDVPEVKNGEIALNVLKKAAEQRGATVVDNNHVVEMHAGIPLPVVARKIKLQLARNTKPTFTPVQDVSAARGSLPRNVMEKLPDDVRMGLEELDEDIALLNSRIKEHTTVYGNPAVMESGAREKFDKMVAELDELAQKREAWREAVEAELGDMAKRKYSYSVLNRLVKAKPIDDSIPVYDPNGNVMGWFFVTPLKGKRLFIPKTPETTKLDEHIWRKQPTIYARYLGVMRDLFGEPIVTPLRNAMRMTQAFEGEYQEWLYNIIKPIIRDKAARERVTYLLEGKKVKGATSTDRKVAAELREWYNDLFKKFGIDANRFLENYAPRIRQAGTIRDAFGTKPPKELTFFAEMERKADTPLFPRETDALIAASEYLRLGARKKFIQPAFDVVDQYKGNRLVFDKTGEVYFSEKAGRQIMHADRIRLLEEFKNSILRRPIWDERLMNGLVDTVGEALGKELGASKRKVLQEFNGFMTHAIYLNTIGLNPMTVLKQLTQQLLSVGTLSGNPAEGLWYWGKAVKALTTKPGRELLKYCWVLQSRVYQEGLEQQSKILAGIRRPVEKAAFYAFEQADKANVSISYMMKLMHSLKQGKPLSEAVEAANAFAADTQFLYGIDSPMFYKSPVGRLVGVLTSYPVNYFRLMYKHGLSKRTAMMGLMTMGASYALTTLTGLDFTNETPLGVAENFLPLSFVLSGTSGTGSIPLNIVRDTSRTITSKLSGMPLDSEEAWKGLQKDLTTLIPFPMVTLRRIVRAARAAQSGGKVYDEEGKLTYKMSPSEIRRSLIGPTVESRERRKEHAEVERAEQTYRQLRDAAVNAYLSGNKAEFNALQKTLIKKGLTPIRASDIKQAMRYRSMTALERHRKGLPKTYTAR